MPARCGLAFHWNSPSPLCGVGLAAQTLALLLEGTDQAGQARPQHHGINTSRITNGTEWV